MCETLSVLSCFSNPLFSGLRNEISGGEASTSPGCLRCGALAQCVIDFKIASVVWTVLYPIPE